MKNIKPKYRTAFAGDVKPQREGVYVVTTDSPGCWGYFLGYFNGQYWYEYGRSDHDLHPGRIPRKKTARLAVTAWAHINAEAFSAALHEEQKAPTQLAPLNATRSEREVIDQALQDA